MSDAPPPRVRERLRELPSVDRLATSVARAELAERRGELLAGANDEVDLVSRARERLRPPLRRVLNATGVVVHTNLGRAPLGASARAAVQAAAEGYSNLEFDLATGERGSRHAHVEAVLREVTGAEAALAVNNCAAAVLLAAAALAGPGRDVVVSRGQQVEIEALCGLGAPVIDDVGSGVLADDMELLAEEPAVRRSVRAGAAVVCFSGDKLLGGPQAGVMVGTREAIHACKRHPLARAVRIDKLSLAALHATLALYRDPGLARAELPVLAMLDAPPEALEARARRLAERCGGGGVAATAKGGGGALPPPEPPRPAAAIHVELAEPLR